MSDISVIKNTKSNKKKKKKKKPIQEWLQPDWVAD